MLRIEINKIVHQKNKNKYFKNFNKNSILLDSKIDIKLYKNTRYILNSVYGISYYTINNIYIKFGMNSYNYKKFLMFDNKFENILNLVNKYFKNKKTVTSVENVNLYKYQKFLNYKGYRHKHGLPVNGQRTSTNAKTCRSMAFHNRLLSIIKKYETDQY